MSPSQDGEMIKIRAAIEKTVKVPEVALGALYVFEGK